MAVKIERDNGEILHVSYYSYYNYDHHYHHHIQFLLTGLFSRNNNNIYNNAIYIAQYGHNFKCAGGRSDQCSVKAQGNKEVISLDLKNHSSVGQVCRRCSKHETLGISGLRYTLCIT